MTEVKLTLLAYLVPLGVLWGVYGWRRGRHERRARARLRESEEAQLLEPPSLHPRVDAALCAGCGSCVAACPEKDVLGLVDGRAQLVAPSDCIGHGACERACPTGAIRLVFGTETRGVDIPFVSESFETNVPGLFIAGELGGMGLIRNAVEQGRQALESIRSRPRESFDLDVVIVGAGPAGLSATLAARQHRLRSVTLEQELLGGTVAHYPRGKVVMTAPMHLPLYGTVKLRQTSKEALLELWQRVVEETGIEIRYGERMQGLRDVGEGFEVRTDLATYRARSVLLAIGRRGTPRRLEVPGEDLPKVIYSLAEPERHRGEHVLVVGGGDSALEAATALAEQAGTTVTLSYRGPSFRRAKARNRERIEAAEACARVQVLVESRVLEVLPKGVRLEYAGDALEIPNDTVVCCTGGILPRELLTSLGIRVETKHGTR